VRFARTVAGVGGRWKGLLVVGALAVGPGMIACSSSDMPRTRRAERAPYVGTDSMGTPPASTRLIRIQARPELVENSAAAYSYAQPGVIFTINDSGNDPLLFALDTTGADRGVWWVQGATDVDWEAASAGPCGGQAITPAIARPNECIYIGDTGDNSEARTSRVIYRVPEPPARSAGFTGALTAEALPYRYPDGAHDVEAMYVPPNGSIYLITKRPRRDAAGRLRPALVFVLPPDAWGKPGPVVAQLVDSLPIVPGSAPLRLITDAGLAPDARFLAVRTYAQVYTFATDPATGRVIGAIPPAVCNIVALNVWPGEGVTWFAGSTKLLLTSEGRFSPMQVVDCPMPPKDP